MPTKPELLDRAAELAKQAGPSFDVSKLPNGRLPVKSDTKASVEGAIGILEQTLGVSPLKPPIPEPAIEPPTNPSETADRNRNEDKQRIDQLCRVAKGCWRSLLRRAPDKLPEGLPVRGDRFDDFLNGLAQDDVPGLEMAAKKLKQLADLHAPVLNMSLVTLIENGLDAFGKTITFPPDIESIVTPIVSITDHPDRRRAIRDLDLKVGQRMADVIRQRQALAALSVVAGGTPERPTFPADPELAENVPINPKPAATVSSEPPGTTEKGSDEMNESQVKALLAEQLAPFTEGLKKLTDAGFVTKGDLKTDLDKITLGLTKQIKDGFDKIVSTELPKAIAAQPGGTAATPATTAGQSTGVVVHPAQRPLWKRWETGVFAGVVALIIIVFLVMSSGGQPAVEIYKVKGVDSIYNSESEQVP